MCLNCGGQPYVYFDNVLSRYRVHFNRGNINVSVGDVIRKQLPDVSFANWFPAAAAAVAGTTPSSSKGDEKRFRYSNNVEMTDV